MKYDEVISKHSFYYRDAYKFLFDWLKEVTQIGKHVGKHPPKGTAYKRTLRKWAKKCGNEELLAEIATRARRVMGYIKQQHPTIQRYL